jgi:hypothetical protein
MSSGAARATALGLLLAALAALCGACQPAGRLFQTTLGPSDRPLPAILGDETGLVVGIEPGEIEPGAFFGPNPTLDVDPADPNTAIVAFFGGMCDQDVKLAFRLHEGTYQLRVDPEEKIGLGCPAAAVSRALRITTSVPIPVAEVLLIGD